MSDDRMFAGLMDRKRPPAAGPSEPIPEDTRIRHMTVNLPERHAAIVDRYFALLYNSPTRSSRSQLVGLALEILDRILEDRAPSRLNATVLDEYVSRHTGTQAPTRAGMQAAAQGADQGARERETRG